jgi:hypothetical protein
MRVSPLRSLTRVPDGVSAVMGACLIALATGIREAGE